MTNEANANFLWFSDDSGTHGDDDEVERSTGFALR